MSTLLIERFHLVLAVYIAVFLLLLAGAVYLFRSRVKTQGAGRTVIINIAVTLFTIFFIFIVFEAIFAYFFVHSHSFGFTLTHQRWSYKYWRPVNSYGYRDYEPEWNGRIAFVVGDSFTAGAGIDNIDDRFANILARKLEDEWTVTVLAQSGWDTPEHLEAIRNHDKRPDLVIVSYFVNDIMKAAINNGIEMAPFDREPPRLLRPLVNYSYFINWVYWLLRRDKDLEMFWEPFVAAYRDAAAWAAHAAELDALIDEVRARGAKLAFVIWPMPTEPGGEKSKFMTSQVEDYLKEKGVFTINLTSLMEGWPARERVVSPFDGHPSVGVNAEVADLLLNTPWLWE